MPERAPRRPRGGPTRRSRLRRRLGVRAAAKWRRCRDSNPGSVARRQFSKLLPGLAEVAQKWLEEQGVRAEDARALAGDLCFPLDQDPEIEVIRTSWPTLRPEIRMAILSLVQVNGQGPQGDPVRPGDRDAEDR